MNVLHTAQSYPPEVSGVSHLVSQLSRRLVARGHSVTVFTERSSNASRDETLDGVRIRRFENSGSLVAGIRGDRRLYLEAVTSGNWDLIVMHCFQTWTTDILLGHLASLSGPCIVVGHGAAYGNPSFASYYDWVARQVPKLSATVSMSSILEDAAFVRDYSLPPPRIIRNGVDMEEWSAPAANVRSRWGLDSRPWVVNVSNHNPNKGHADLWHVAGKIQRQHPETRFNIVGGTYPAARYRLGMVGVTGGCWYECLAKSVCRGGVRLARNVPRRDVVSAMKEADVFLLTSRWEADPLSILESMAAGTPWVSFDVGCVRENKGGIVVRDADEMVTVTRELLQRAEVRTSLAEAGIAQIKAGHDWDDIAGQYERLYLESISKKSP
jgi:glycosyltransferase involved in cell wall biosynthesis